MKILTYIVLFVFSVLWLAGCSGDFAKWLYDNELIEDDYRYGDLYRMANLPRFRELREECPIIAVPKVKESHLVLAGDSFTEEGRIEEEDLASERFTRIRVDGASPMKLDSRQKNILVIETVERHVRERFANPWRGVLVNETEYKGQIPWYKKMVHLEMPYSTERHEAVLFGFDWTMRIREWKALLNYKLFDRVDEHVVLNKSKEHLLYYMAVKSGISSAFDPIPHDEINRLVSHINEARRHYKKQGFDEVVLSIIPNKASILGKDLGKYNELINRIEQHPSLEVPVIDVYPDFEKMGSQAYAKGDTHWSCTGRQLWIDKLNQVLRQVSSSKVSTKAEVL